MAVLEAVGHLGLEEIHLISPYQPWLTELAERFWKAAGLRIASVLPVRAQGGYAPYSMTPGELVDQVKQLWCALAEETVTGLPAKTVEELPGILTTLTANVDTRSTPPKRSPARSSRGTAEGRAR